MGLYTHTCITFLLLYYAFYSYVFEHGFRISQLRLRIKINIVDATNTSIRNVYKINDEI